MTEETQVTQDDLNHLLVVLQNTLEGFVAKFDTRLLEIEARIEFTEKINAILLTGYGEIAAIVDAFYDHLAAGLNEEELRTLNEKIEVIRKEFFRILSEKSVISESGSVEQRDNESYTAVDDVAE